MKIQWYFWVLIKNWKKKRNLLNILFVNFIFLIFLQFFFVKKNYIFDNFTNFKGDLLDNSKNIILFF